MSAAAPRVDARARQEGLDLVDLAGAVYGPGRSRGQIAGFADRVYGPEDQVPYHSANAIRRYWLAELRGRIRGDYDNVLVLTGRKGRGKSTLALCLGLWLDPRFTIDQVAYRSVDLVAMYGRLRRGQVAIYDEAVLGLMSTDFASFESRELVKAVTIARDAHVTTILCLPKFSRLNKGFREDLTDFWVRCDERGVAVVHPAYPRERYSDWKGLGWFPDREWNPLEWPSLRGVPLFTEYLKRRKAARVTFHKVAESRLGGQGGGSEATAGRLFTCAPCGVSFGRADHLQRHLLTSGHRKATAGHRGRSRGTWS